MDASKYKHGSVDSDETIQNGNKNENERKEDRKEEKESNPPAAGTHTERHLDTRFRGSLARWDKHGNPHIDNSGEAGARKRFVGRSWPRDPKGEFITSDSTLSWKMTSNGVQLWGATLCDFYFVNRSPKVKNMTTISSGSKLVTWMRAHGELEHAAQEIAWADEEEDPHEVFPCDIANLIERAEDKVRQRLWGRSMRLEEKVEEKEEEKKSTSLFDTSVYPAPWPLVPFSYLAPKIQNYIPLHRLPKKLIVHDPWYQLSVNEYDYEHTGNADWTKKPDVTHLYSLKLSPEATKRLEAEKMEAAEQEKKVLRFGSLIRPNDNEPGPIEPPVFVVYPPTPPEEPIEEAHLYISPAHAAGRGNHSVVYHAEWEVPRSMLIRPRLCTSCVIEDVKKILTEKDGADESRIDSQWKMRSATLKKVQHADYPVTVKVAENQNAIPHVDDDDDKDLYTLVDGETYDITEFEGPVRKIHTRVQWPSSSAPDSIRCPHQNRSPPTAKVLLIAKLSLEYDGHLANEARNYQKFPKHMFEHWNGFNILPPMHDPTPVGAVVPQFYGYYVPSDDSSGRKCYLSPILLMEDCGVQLSPGAISFDDKLSPFSGLHESAPLIFAISGMNVTLCITASTSQAGSMARLPNEISLYSTDRSLSVPLELRPHSFAKREFSFRLIDFGRSCEVGDSKEVLMEREDVRRMFGDPVY